MDLPSNAPVSAQTQTRIAAPPSVVWRVLTELQGWPDWNPDVQWIRVYGNLESGTVFRWKSGLASIRSRIRVVEPQRLVAWTGVAPGVKALHIWRFTEERGCTVVWTGETFQGWLPFIFRRSMRKQLVTALEASIAALRAESERRVADGLP